MKLLLQWNDKHLNIQSRSPLQCLNWQNVVQFYDKGLIWAFPQPIHTFREASDSLTSTIHLLGESVRITMAIIITVILVYTCMYKYKAHVSVLIHSPSHLPPSTPPLIASVSSPAPYHIISMQPLKGNSPVTGYENFYSHTSFCFIVFYLWI